MTELSTSKNLLLHKSNENTGKTVKINIFRTLEINQKLETIQKCLFKKNGLILKITMSAVNILTCLSPMLLSLAPNQQHHNHSNCQNQQPSHHWTGEVWVWSSPKAPYSDNYHYLTCTVAPWKSLVTRLLFIWSDSELIQHTLQSICQK